MVGGFARVRQRKRRGAEHCQSHIEAHEEAWHIRLRQRRGQHRILQVPAFKRAGFHSKAQRETCQELEAQGHVRRACVAMPDAPQRSRQVRPPRQREMCHHRVWRRAGAPSRHPGQTAAHGRRQGVRAEADDDADDPRAEHLARCPLAGGGGLHDAMESRGDHPARQTVLPA